MRTLLILILFFSNTLSTYAKFDYALSESRKCSNMFTHFEKKYKLPKNILHAISLQETAKKHENYDIRLVWPWSVNVEGKGYYFNNKITAVNFVKKQLSLGIESIDVGCMQINLKYHAKAFKTVSEAFTPKLNIAYGAEFLTEKYHQAGSWPKAIGAYHSSSHNLSDNYYNNVQKIYNSLDSYKKKLDFYAYDNRAVAHNNLATNTKTQKTTYLYKGLPIRTTRIKATKPSRNPRF